MTRVTVSVLINQSLKDGSITFTPGGAATEAHDIYLSWDTSKVTKFNQLQQAVNVILGIASSSLGR